MEPNQLRNGYLYAVRLLTSSKKSSAELRVRLVKKGYPDTVVEEIITRLQKARLLSDESLVRDTIHWGLETKRLGRNRIFLELVKRKISQSLIEAELVSFSKTKEREIAESLAQERWERLKNLDVRKRKKKVYALLVSRGFDYELCREILSKLSPKEYESI